MKNLAVAKIVLKERLTMEDSVVPVRLEMFCVVCGKAVLHKFIMDFGDREVWQCDSCDLREPRNKGDVQLQREDPKAPEKILTKQVQSDSNPDVFYTLTKDSSGWRCDCPGFRYRSQCKHAKTAEKEER